jgi:hypothetical protein
MGGLGFRANGAITRQPGGNAPGKRTPLNRQALKGRDSFPPDPHVEKDRRFHGIIFMQRHSVFETPAKGSETARPQSR